VPIFCYSHLLLRIFSNNFFYKTVKMGVSEKNIVTNEICVQ
jgi:hypothetical protein